MELKQKPELKQKLEKLDYEYDAQSAGDNIMKPHGIAKFCIKCDLTKHESETCRAIVHCDYCMASSGLIWKASTHKTEKCREAIKDATIAEEEPAPPA
jgi:hypothetical protein